MLEITKVEILGISGAIRGMRNSWNSHDKSDSLSDGKMFSIGQNDCKLMQKLANAGSSHAKFRRMITIQCDIVAPLYWWKEYDTYKVGTVANSCSTMHTVHCKKFTTEDFSCKYSKELFNDIIDRLNELRISYLENKEKEYWYQMIELLPSSYNQLRTVQLNYEVLTAIYHDRKSHKLDEWVEFCRWVESLPYAELITG